MAAKDSMQVQMQVVDPESESALCRAEHNELHLRQAYAQMLLNDRYLKQISALELQSGFHPTAQELSQVSRHGGPGVVRHLIECGNSFVRADFVTALIWNPCDQVPQLIKESLSAPGRTVRRESASDTTASPLRNHAPKPTVSTEERQRWSGSEVLEIFRDLRVNGRLERFPLIYSPSPAPGTASGPDRKSTLDLSDVDPRALSQIFCAVDRPLQLLDSSIINCDQLPDLFKEVLQTLRRGSYRPDRVRVLLKRLSRELPASMVTCMVEENESAEGASEKNAPRGFSLKYAKYVAPPGNDEGEFRLYFNGNLHAVF
ncbi:MAG: hypothetical protein ACYCOU_12785 [Sulfobacillus sp.]